MLINLINNVIIENNHCNTEYCITAPNNLVCLNMSKLPPIETHSYPDKPQIIYKEEKRTFYYTVLREGFYPNKKLLKFTRKSSSFPLPDNYVVVTT